MNPSGIQRPIGFSPQEISSLINEDVVTQHAENAAFLWLLRDAATYAPHYSLKDLADLDERVAANLDGLLVAGTTGWEICAAALEIGDSGELFTAAALAFESGDPERIKSVLNLGCSEPELSRALVSALGWLTFTEAKKVIAELLKSDNPELRRIGIAASAVHRRDPGPALSQALGDQDPRLRSRALKAAGELGRIDLLPVITQSISASDDACRFYAAWSAAILGSRSEQVSSTLQEIAQSNSRYAVRALDMACRVLDLPSAMAWYQQLKTNADQLRLALIAAGAIGVPELIDDILELMAVDEIKRVAGEAFAMLTGVALAYENLDGDAPEGFESGPSEDPEDDDVALAPDEDLPWPVPELVEPWWKERKGQYKSGIRYLRGTEITKESLQDTLQNGNQRQRTAAALEMSLGHPKQPLFEVRAPGKRQLEML